MFLLERVDPNLRFNNVRVEIITNTNPWFDVQWFLLSNSQSTVTQPLWVPSGMSFKVCNSTWVQNLCSYLNVWILICDSTTDSGSEVRSPIRSKSGRFGSWGEMHFPSSISSKLFGVMNSRYTRTRLACWNVHYRAWKLIISILVSQFRSSDPTLCEQSVEHDHLHEYYPAEGITADSVETLLLGFGVLFLEHRYSTLSPNW